MRYCSNCGTQNESQAKFCSACGTQLEPLQAAKGEALFQEPEPEQTVQTPEQGYQAPPQGYQAPPQGYQAPPQGYQAPPQGYQVPPQGYQASPVAPPITAKGKTFGIIGFILGIISTVFCWLGIFPAAGIVLGFFMIAAGIVGLVFCNISKNEGYFPLAKVGKVFSIIGICLSGVFWLIGIFITVAAFSASYY